MTQLNPDGAQPQLPDAELRLPRPPGVFRRWLAERPRAVDWTIVGVYLFGCLLMVAAEVMTGIATRSFTDLEPGAVAEMEPLLGLHTWAWSLLRLAITAVTAAALLLRRRYPLQGLLIVYGLMLFDQGLLIAPNTVAVMFLLYAVPVFRSVLAGWIGFACLFVMNVVLMLFGRSVGDGFIGPFGVLAAETMNLSQSIGLAIGNGLWMLAVLMIGINLGNRRRYVDALIDRARQLAREREQQAQLAAAGERARIAREMHDIVAHSLSVIVTLSEAAAITVDQQPEAAKQAMQRASETGREALAEMRRLLGVLQDPAAGKTPGTSLAPQPGAAQLPELVAGFREAGLDVALAEHGTPAGDSGHQLTVYRIVQEALTNALRYAGSGAFVDASVSHTADMTEITVTDGGAGGEQTASGHGRRDPIVGSGLGIQGARQRAELFGGALDAGPHGAGWRLHAVLPVRTSGTTMTVEEQA